MSSVQFILRRHQSQVERRVVHPQETPITGGAEFPFSALLPLLFFPFLDVRLLELEFPLLLLLELECP